MQGREAASTAAAGGRAAGAGAGGRGLQVVLWGLRIAGGLLTPFRPTWVSAANFVLAEVSRCVKSVHMRMCMGASPSQVNERSCGSWNV